MMCVPNSIPVSDLWSIRSLVSSPRGPPVDIAGWVSALEDDMREGSESKVIQDCELVGLVRFLNNHIVTLIGRMDNINGMHFVIR